MYIVRHPLIIIVNVISLHCDVMPVHCSEFMYALYACAVCPHKSHRGVLKKWVLTLRGSNITHMEIKERIRCMGRVRGIG